MTAALLTLAATTTLFASGPVFWTIATPTELLKGTSDGVTVVDVDQTKLPRPKDKGYSDPKTKPLRGHIGLQDSHSPAGNYIEFRNIRPRPAA